MLDEELALSMVLMDGGTSTVHTYLLLCLFFGLDSLV